MSRRFRSLSRWAGLALLAGLAVRGAPAQDGADLSPVGLDLVRPLVEEGRWVWLGDSFSVPTLNRVPVGTLLTWPLGRIGAVSFGARSQLGRLDPSGAGGRLVAPEDGYLLARGTAEERGMGLPVYRVAEWDLPEGGSDLGTLDLRLSLLADGSAGARGQALVGAAVRPVLYGHGKVEATGSVVVGGTPSPVPIRGFSLGEATPVARADVMLPVRASLQSGGYVHVAGSVVAGAPGHYAQFLGDTSWSYWGFAQDALPALPDSVKRFRTTELASFLLATTLDPEQEAVAVLYLAPEYRGRDELRTTITAAVARIRTAFTAVGLDEPVVLLLHPHAVESEYVNTPERNERAGVVMREIALADPRVAFFSLYEATSGVVFDGRQAARSWLRDSGRVALSYGVHTAGQAGPLRLIADHQANLLDDARLHPTEVGAAFFSALLYEGITGQPVSTEPPPEDDEEPAFRLAPNPVRPGGRVGGAVPWTPVYDVLGRRIARADGAGTFEAPRAPGVYLVGGRRLVVR